MQLCLPDGTQQPRLSTPIPSPACPRGWKEERPREGDIHKGISWKKTYRSSVLWWVGHQKGWIIPTPASYLLCDFKGSHTISPPNTSSLHKYLYDSVCKLKNQSPIHNRPTQVTCVTCCIQKIHCFLWPQLSHTCVHWSVSPGNATPLQCTV